MKRSRAFRRPYPAKALTPHNNPKRIAIRAIAECRVQSAEGVPLCILHRAFCIVHFASCILHSSTVQPSRDVAELLQSHRTALTPSPSPSRGEEGFRSRTHPTPPLPLRERGLGGEGCPAFCGRCTSPGRSHQRRPNYILWTMVIVKYFCYTTQILDLQLHHIHRIQNGARVAGGPRRDQCYDPSGRGWRPDHQSQASSAH